MKKLLLFLCALTCSAAMSAATWNVTVPEGTKACYIAGNLNGWTFSEMTKVDDTHYTITVETENTKGYKYASGPDWTYEELTATGGNVSDREYAENDVVAKWKNVYDPGVEISYVDITISVKATSAPTIWWWGAGDKCPNADKTYTWDTQPAMTAVAGKTGWYEWEFKDVNATTGVTFKINQGSDITAKESTCYNAAGSVIDCEGGDDPDPVGTVYVVTGGSGVIFGTTWDNNSACVLEKQADGSYAWTKEDVELTASTIEYQYLEKGTWNGWQLPVSGNASFSIDKAGKYDLTFTLSADLGTQNVQVTLKEEVEVKSLIKCLHGTFTGTWANTEEFTYNAAKTEATLTLALEADKDCEFGMRFTDADWKANGATLTAENNSTNITEGSGNMHIVTTVAGNYVFKYVNETNILSVTYPQTTSFESATSEKTATKIIRNGQVLIIRDGVAYDMMGQEVK